MPQKSAIEWTDYTSNPIKARDPETGKVGWACAKVSAGCANCYAETINKRFGTQQPFSKQGTNRVEHFVNERELESLLKSRAISGKRVFLGDMTDIFGEWVPDSWLDRVFAVFALRPDVTFQILTKRPERAADYTRSYDRGTEETKDYEKWRFGIHEAAVDLKERYGRGAYGAKPTAWAWPLKNLWLGTSVENQEQTGRIAALRRCPAAIRFLSCEPLLGPLNLRWIPLHREGRFERAIDVLQPTVRERFGEGQPSCRPFDRPDVTCPPEKPFGPKIHWVIAGGESGPNARPIHPEWVRSLRDQCVNAGVPFFFKQWGAWAPAYRQSADKLKIVTCHAAPVPREPDSHDWDDGSTSLRIGKKAAGRELDGETWDQMPRMEFALE